MADNNNNPPANCGNNYDEDEGIDLSKITIPNITLLKGDHNMEA
jgi:hypothetical protein